MPIVEIKSGHDFDALTLTGLSIVDFWAGWCQPCKTMGKVLDAVVGRLPASVTVAKVDVEALPDLASRVGVRSIPMVVMFRNGVQVDSWVGVQKEETIVEAVQTAMMG